MATLTESGSGGSRIRVCRRPGAAVVPATLIVMCVGLRWLIGLACGDRWRVRATPIKSRPWRAVRAAGVAMTVQARQEVGAAPGADLGTGTAATNAHTVIAGGRRRLGNAALP
jgi:hypothetical protein